MVSLIIYAPQIKLMERNDEYENLSGDVGAYGVFPIS